MLTIKIKYFNDNIERLRYIDGKSDWIDLRAAERVELRAGEFRLIPLGIAMELPKGYEAHIVPRSSTFKQFGILQTNHCGIVDESYCGDNDQWFFPALVVLPIIDSSFSSAILRANIAAASALVMLPSGLNVLVAGRSASLHCSPMQPAS